jgi:hypothetical protein
MLEIPYRDVELLLARLVSVVAPGRAALGLDDAMNLIGGQIL